MNVGLVVLFGAGASYGSGNVVPYSPPLGDGLFDDLARRDPGGWGALPGELQGEFKLDFEKGMLSLVEKHSHAVGPLMRVMTAYFASFRLDGSGLDLYSRLLSGLGRNLGHILFSSLNYECLFEIAVSMRGLTNEYFSDGPVSAGHVRISKLHGSCNFRAPGIRVAPRGVSYAGSGVSFTPGALEAVSPQDAIAAVQGDGLYSAMCLYTVHKPIQIGTEVIRGMQEAWANSVRSAEKVIVIGTRPHDEDRHLWEPLADTDAALYFVGNRESFNEWVRRSGRSATKSHLLAPRFGDAVADIHGLLRA
jgi:hypothetical protein